MMDVVERYKDYLDFFIMKTIDFLKVADHYIRDVGDILEYLDSWFLNTLGESGRKEIVDRIIKDVLRLKLSAYINLRGITPIIIFYYPPIPMYMSINFIHNKILIMRDGLYLINEHIIDVYINGQAPSDLMLPEVLLYILSLHSDKSTSDVIKSIFEDVGIMDVFDGITMTFTPAYGLTEHTYKYFNSKLDVKLSFSERDDVCSYLNNSLWRLKVYDFDKYLGTQRVLEGVYVSEQPLYEDTTGGYRESIGLYLFNNATSITITPTYEFKPIDLVRLIDLATSGMMYYYIVLSKVYENVVRKY